MTEGHRVAAHKRVRAYAMRFFLACTLPDAANFDNEITARTKSSPRRNRDIVQNLSNAPCVRVGEINCGGHGFAVINDPALLRFWTDFRKRFEPLRH